MYKTTTPTHTFTIPFNVSQVSKLMLTYKQDKLSLEFDESDVTMENKSISVTLTQEQTNLFKADKHVSIQMKILTTSNSVLASNIIQIKVANVLNDKEFDI